jgi:hypothetical protein
MENFVAHPRIAGGTTSFRKRYICYKIHGLGLPIFILSTDQMELDLLAPR